MTINHSYTPPTTLNALRDKAQIWGASLLAKGRHHVATMVSLRQLQKTAMQLGVYCLLLAGCLGLVANGSKLIVDQIHAKMFEMGYEVAKQNLPKKIETASIRPSID